MLMLRKRLGGVLHYFALLSHSVDQNVLFLTPFAKQHLCMVLSANSIHASPASKFIVALKILNAIHSL